MRVFAWDSPQVYFSLDFRSCCLDSLLGVLVVVTLANLNMISMTRSDVSRVRSPKTERPSRQKSCHENH